MFRFVVSMLMGIVCAVLVFATNPALFNSIRDGIVLALLQGLTLYLGDGVKNLVSKRPLIDRLLTWFVVYEHVPAGIILLLAGFGMFTEPLHLTTVYLMCLPASLVALCDYVDILVFLRS